MRKLVDPECVPYTLYGKKYKRLTPNVYVISDMDDSGQTVKKLIKFSEHRYGVKVHEYCHQQGFAPELYDVKELPGGWFQVTMEYIEGLVDFAFTIDALSQWEEILKKLHTEMDTVDAGGNTIRKEVYVHGDLRPGNLKLKDGKVMVLDFDWAGTVQDTYPEMMNHNIKWHDSAYKLATLQPAHDDHFLDDIKEELEELDD